MIHRAIFSAIQITGGLAYFRPRRRFQGIWLGQRLKRAGAAHLCASSRGRHDLSFDDVRPPDMRGMVGELRCRQQSRDPDRDRAQGNIESMIIGVIVTSLPCQV